MGSICQVSFPQIYSCKIDFCRFGGATTGTEMTGKNFDKWLKDAGVIGKDITTTMTGIAFSKVAG